MRATATSTRRSTAQASRSSKARPTSWTSRSSGAASTRTIACWSPHLSTTRWRRRSPRFSGRALARRRHARHGFLRSMAICRLVSTTALRKVARWRRTEESSVFGNAMDAMHPETFTDIAIARIDSDGTLDSTFDGDGKVMVDFSLGGTFDGGADALVRADGRIVAVGEAQTSVGSKAAVTRLTLDGQRDDSFDLDGRVSFGFDAGNPTAFASATALAEDDRVATRDRRVDQYERQRRFRDRSIAGERIARCGVRRWRQGDRPVRSCRQPARFADVGAGSARRHHRRRRLRLRGRQRNELPHARYRDPATRRGGTAGCDVRLRRPARVRARHRRDARRRGVPGAAVSTTAG